MGRFGRRAGLLAVVAGLFIAAPAVAQSWSPDRPVTIVVPATAGSPVDLVARAIQPKMQEALGQPLVVENRAGATGTIGANVVARAAPDGQTVMLTADLPITMAPAMFATPYDPFKDLAIIGLFGETVQMVVANPAAGIGTLPLLIARAKAQPDKLSFASAGNGSPGHLCSEMLAQTAGIRMTHVPYRGAAPATQALVAGEVDLFCGPVPQLLPQVQAGRLVSIGLASAKRSLLHPDLPTLSEQGMTGFAMSTRYGLFLPAGTPAPIVARLSQAFQGAFADAEVRRKLAAASFELGWTEPGPARDLLAADLEKWRGVIKAGNIKAN